MPAKQLALNCGKFPRGRRPPRGAQESTASSGRRFEHSLLPRPDWLPWSLLLHLFLLLERFEGTARLTGPGLLDPGPLPPVCSPATIHSPHRRHPRKPRGSPAERVFFPPGPSGSSKLLVLPSPTVGSPLPWEGGRNRPPIPGIRRSVILGLRRSASALLDPRGLPAAAPARAWVPPAAPPAWDRTRDTHGANSCV